MPKFAKAAHQQKWHDAPSVVASLARNLIDAVNSEQSTALTGFALSPRMMHEVSANFLSHYTHAEHLKEFRSRMLNLESESQTCPSNTAGESLPLPRKILHIVPNNLVVSAWESVFQGMLVGAHNRVRVPGGLEAEFAFFMEQFKQCEPDTERWVSTAQWDSNDEMRTRSEIASADCVTVFGSEETVLEIQSLTSDGTRLITHGFRFGIAILGDFSQIEDPLERLAYDFAVYDQRGCLSPRSLFLIGTSDDDAVNVAKKLCKKIRQQQNALHPGKLSLSESAALRRVYDETQWGNKHTRSVNAPGEEFLVTLSLRPSNYSPPFAPRHLDIVALNDWKGLMELLDPWKTHLAVVGTLPLIDNVLSAFDASTRICSFGDMQRPPLGWLHDGLPPLVPFLLSDSGVQK